MHNLCLFLVHECMSSVLKVDYESKIPKQYSVSEHVQTCLEYQQMSLIKYTSKILCSV